VHLQLHFPARLSSQMQFHGRDIAAGAPLEYGNNLIPAGLTLRLGNPAG
jgi:hypothetical protein